jgi:hypothetical protein
MGGGKMKSVFVCAALILALGAAGLAAYGILNYSADMQSVKDSIDNIDSRLRVAESAVAHMQRSGRNDEPSALSQAVEREMASLREKVEQANSRVEDIDTRVVKLDESGKENARQVAELASAASGGRPSEGMVRREDVERIVEQKMKQNQPGHQKPPPELSEVAQKMGLGNAEQKELEDIIRKKQQQQLELFKTPRADGSNLLDDLAAGLVAVRTSGQPSEEAIRQVYFRFYQRVATEKVPGTNHTYAQAMRKTQEEAYQAMKSALSDEKFEMFQSLGVRNPMDMRIADDPVGKYIQQRFKEAGISPDGPRPPGK